MSKQTSSEECACCSKPAVGFEPRFGYWYCEDHACTPPVDIDRLRARKVANLPTVAEVKGPYVPLVPDTRLVEIIRGYIASNSTPSTRPAMDSEMHLLALCRLVVDEAKARLPLAALEQGEKQ